MYRGRPALTRSRCNKPLRIDLFHRMGSMTEFCLPWPGTGLRRSPAVSLSPSLLQFKSAPSVHSRLQVSDSTRRRVLVLRSLLGISFKNGKGTCVMPWLFSPIWIKSSTLWGQPAMTTYCRSLFPSFHKEWWKQSSIIFKGQDKKTTKLCGSHKTCFWSSFQPCVHCSGRRITKQTSLYEIKQLCTQE